MPGGSRTLNGPLRIYPGRGSKNPFSESLRPHVIFGKRPVTSVPLVINAGRSQMFYLSQGDFYFNVKQISPGILGLKMRQGKRGERRLLLALQCPLHQFTSSVGR